MALPEWAPLVLLWLPILAFFAVIWHRNRKRPVAATEHVRPPDPIEEALRKAVHESQGLARRASGNDWDALGQFVATATTFLGVWGACWVYGGLLGFMLRWLPALVLAVMAAALWPLVLALLAMGALALIVLLAAVFTQ